MKDSTQLISRRPIEIKDGERWRSRAVEQPKIPNSMRVIWQAGVEEVAALIIGNTDTHTHTHTHTWI